MEATINLCRPASSTVADAYIEHQIGYSADALRLNTLWIGDWEICSGRLKSDARLLCALLFIRSQTCLVFWLNARTTIDAESVLVWTSICVKELLSTVVAGYAWSLFPLEPNCWRMDSWALTADMAYLGKGTDSSWPEQKEEPRLKQEEGTESAHVTHNQKTWMGATKS